jgi:hypothetical protein
MFPYDLVTLLHSHKSLKGQPSTMSNFDLAMVARSLELQETPALSKRNLATKSVFECRLVPSRNFQAAVEPPLVCLQVMDVMRCHYELPVQRTTRQRLVVNSSHTLVVLPWTQWITRMVVGITKLSTDLTQLLEVPHQVLRSDWLPHAVRDEDAAREYEVLNYGT